MNLLITGVSDYLGQAVVRRILVHNPFKRVFGLDRRPPRVLGPVHFLPVDPRSEEVTDLLIMNDIQVVLHLAYAQRSDGAKEELGVAQRLLEAGALAGTRRIVFASRDRVYAAGEGPRDEASPLCRPEGLPAELLGKLAVEEALAKAPEDGPVPVVLRLGNVIGPQPGSPLDPLLNLPVVLTRRGQDPWVQFLHIDDAAALLLAAAERPGLRGAFNAAGLDPIRLSVMAGILQRPVWSLPAPLFRGVSDLLGRVHRPLVALGGASALLAGVPLCSQRQAELGVAPRYTTRQTLAVWRTGQPGGGRSGTLKGPDGLRA